VVRLMIPRLIGVAAVQLNFWVNTRIASTLPEGSVNGVTYAFTLMLMPQAAIAQSIAIAAMPTFSAQFALDKFDEMRNSLAASLRGVILLALPASLGLILLRLPLVELLLQRGNFDPRSSELVAWALLWYGTGLVGHSLVEVLVRAFYAMHDTKTPVIITLIAMSLNVLFSVAFSALFTRLGWMPHGGLALANSLATALEMTGLTVLMRRRLNGINGRDILAGTLQAAGATLLMSLALAGWIALTGSQPAWRVALGGVAIGGVVYGPVVLALGAREARGIVHALRRGGKRILGQPG
jgi:putative peptidoglycan lipid II flippase